MEELIIDTILLDSGNDSGSAGRFPIFRLIQSYLNKYAIQMNYAFRVPYTEMLLDISGSILFQIGDIETLDMVVKTSPEGPFWGQTWSEFTIVSDANKALIASRLDVVDWIQDHTRIPSRPKGIIPDKDTLREILLNGNIPMFKALLKKIHTPIKLEGFRYSIPTADEDDVDKWLFKESIHRKTWKKSKKR